ncbi:hypothetical protein LOAG_16163, partial [Loa loa]
TNYLFIKFIYREGFALERLSPIYSVNDFLCISWKKFLHYAVIKQQANTQEISHINMRFIYFVVVIFVQLSNFQITEAQTEQTKLLDLSVQGLNDEQMGNLLLLAEVADKMPKAKI